MELALQAPVQCTDGECGSVSAIVVSPNSQQVIYVVVRGKDPLLGEYLVPIDAIAEGTEAGLRLKWSRGQLGEAERFDKALLVGSPDADSAVLWPYATTGEMNFGAAPPPAYIQVEEVPGDGVPIHVGAHVNATDGRIGQVDELLVDAATGTVTHLVLRRGHLWGKHEVTVPTSAISSVQDDIVYLRLTKAAVTDLPSAPTHKH